jgi:DNA-binding transcriptional LysR family regulator
VGAGAARAAAGDGPGDHPLARQPSVSLAALAREPFVFFDPHVGTGLYDDILGLLRRYGHTPVIAQEVGEAMTIIGLVAAGLGVSILPASFQRVQLSEMRWLPIDEQDAVSEMWLVWSKHHEQGRWQNAFVRRCWPGKASIIEAKRGWKCAVNHKAK